MKYEELCNRTELTNDQYEKVIGRLGASELRLLIFTLHAAVVLGDVQDTLKKRLIYGKEGVDLDRELTVAWDTLSSLVEVCKVMRPAELQDVRERLFPLGMRRVLHGILGTATEAAELQDALRKHLIDGEPLDGDNVLEEVGDSQWYHSAIVNALGSTFAEVQAANIAKLRVRYPDNFKEVDALERNIEAERRALDTQKEMDRAKKMMRYIELCRPNQQKTTSMIRTELGLTDEQIEDLAKRWESMFPAFRELREALAKMNPDDELDVYVAGDPAPAIEEG